MNKEETRQARWGCRLRQLLCGLVLLVWGTSGAGTLSFQLTLSDRTVAVKHTGDEAVFHLAVYGLDRDRSWRPLPSSALPGVTTLLPGQSLDFQHAPQATDALGRADPLLVMFKDAAGSRMVHLAWRQTPGLPPVLLPFERKGQHVMIRHPAGSAMPYRRSWVIGVASDGIAALAGLAQDGPVLSPPVELAWNPAFLATQSLTVDTGKGQRGLWLAHETASGELFVQVIGDGIAAGTEQKPVWLTFFKNRGFELALALLFLGLGVAAVTRFLAPRRQVKQAAQAGLAAAAAAAKGRA